jgi:hypothetical protein
MRRIITVAALACAAVGASAGPAFAHGSYTKGDLEIVTGFATEPAYIDQPNAVQLVMTRAGDPVTDVRPGDVNVTVGFGGQTTELALEPQFEVGEWGTPGDYRAAFIPTQPGKYTFDVEGTVDGQRVDYSMTSGKDTFSEVQDTGPAMFPAVDAPSTTELATKIDAESARTGDAIAAANHAADSAKTLAIVAGVIAIVALGTAVVTVTRSRRTVTT